MIPDSQFFVYILASRKHGTLYIGMTNDLLRRTYEHREGMIEGFTRRYGVKRLVYYETYQNVRDAIQREKALKEWRRDWKIALIERENPDWSDLYYGIAGSTLVKANELRSS
jgi:putative endonuclease